MGKVYHVNKDCQVRFKKKDPYMPHRCCLQLSYFKYSDTDSLEGKQWEKVHNLYPNLKKATLLSVIADFRRKKIIRMKEEHHIIITELTHWEDNHNPKCICT